MAKTLDYESIINNAAEQLEARFNEIQEEMTPLRQEEKEVAEAIRRIVGSYPSGYSNGAASRASGPRAASSAPRESRERKTPEERESEVMSFVSEHPEGVTAVQVAESLSVSVATATKAVNALLEAGTLKSEGQRKSRRLKVA